MDISQLQTAFQEGSEQSRLTQSLQEQKAALQEGKMPGPAEYINPGGLSSEQRDMNDALLPGDGQEQASLTDTPADGRDPIFDIPDERPMEQGTHPETGEPLEIDGEPVGEDGLTDSQREDVEEMRDLGDDDGARDTAQNYRSGNRDAWEQQTGRDCPDDVRWPDGYGTYGY